MALALLVGIGSGYAQETPETEESQEAQAAAQSGDLPVDVAAIQQRVSTLEAQAERSKDDEKELELLQGALRAIDQATDEEATAAQLAEEVRRAPDVLQRLAAELEVPIEESVRVVPAEASFEVLSQELLRAQAELEAAQTQYADLERQLNDRATRLQVLLTRIPETTQELRAIDEVLQSLSDIAADSPLADAQRIELLARKHVNEKLLARLEIENQGYAPLTDLIRARRDQAERRVGVPQRHADDLRNRVDQERRQQAEEARLAAEAEQRRAGDAHPIVQDILAENSELAAEYERITARNRELGESTLGLEQEIASWGAKLDLLRTQEQHIGLSELIGIRLRADQAQLPDPTRLKTDLSLLAKELQETQERWFELNTFEDPLAELESRLEEVEDLDERSRGEVRMAAQEALVRRAEILALVESTYDDYLPSLSEAYETEAHFAELVDDYEDFIGERILWTKSTSRFALTDLPQAWDALGRLVQFDRWATTYRGAVDDVRRTPVQFGLLAGLFASLAILRLNYSGRLRRVVHRRERLIHTVHALLLTTVLAATIPLMVWIVASWIGRGTDPEGFSLALSYALHRTAVLLFLLFLADHLCRPTGLGEMHLGWRRANTEFARKQLRWFTPLAVPLMLIGTLAWQRASVTHDEALARIILVLGFGVLAVFAGILLNPEKGVFKRVLSRHPDGWLNRLRLLWYPAMILLPLTLLVLSLLGYSYTSAEILTTSVNTAFVILGLMAVYGVLLRGLALAERRLAFDQAREAAASAQQEAGAVEEEEHLDLDRVSVQAERLLKFVVAAGILIATLTGWSEVFAGVGVLRRVEIGDWTTTRMVGGQETIVAITLADVALGIVILIGTFFLSRNVAGPLEMTITRRLPLSPGARYAFTTITRYLIVLTGLIVGFQQLGIGWSKVQWLAAGATVGLGFGLQEIFANFVSGLILLFERPVRVGDTVTIGEITGTVTRIRMRATTVLDWDRKELLIPNKEFVTGQIVNWTLSDAVMRVRVKVGIAYGSDTATARDLLYQVAAENRCVLRDPPPDVRFIEFGDSSLNFELRVFVGDIDDYITVRDELNEAIDQAFRSKGVEIAFPQRDLHIRTVKTEIPVKEVKPGRKLRPVIEEIRTPTSPEKRRT